jgi:hypothetical protein
VRNAKIDVFKVCDVDSRGLIQHGKTVNSYMMFGGAAHLSLGGSPKLVPQSRDPGASPNWSRILNVGSAQMVIHHPKNHA